jgi:ABC-type nickel/cobalt efflux system permease component RcnA
MTRLNSKSKLAIGLVLLFALASPVGVLAHPLGNFTINHYAGLHVTREAIEIDYVLDMAEIPAFQEIQKIDANGNGAVDDSEAAAYRPMQCNAILSHLDLRADGQTLALTLSASAIEFPPGAGDLPTLRLSCVFRATHVAVDDIAIAFRDNSYAGRLGWREIVVTGEGVSLQGDFATRSASEKLRTYPEDLLSSPIVVRETAFHYTLEATQPAVARRTIDPSTTVPATRDDVFTRLITLADLSLPTVAFALVVSFIWGAMHALSPGHGKTMVAAYLVGARGTSRHAIVLGLTVTLTHTAGVFALGFVTLFASNYILPDQLYPYLSLASGLLVLGIGLTLMITRLRAARDGRGLIPHTHHHGQHDHHHHDHHHHDHHHDHGHDHTHSPYNESGHIRMRSLIALGVSGGLIPCPTALVVLLSAIALGRIGLGLMLIFAFSAGLAAVLVAIGLLLVQGHRLFDRIPTESRVLRLLPLTGAFLVIVTGVIMTAQALSSVGSFTL